MGRCLRCSVPGSGQNAFRLPTFPRSLAVAVSLGMAVSLTACQSIQTPPWLSAQNDTAEEVVETPPPPPDILDMAPPEPEADPGLLTSHRAAPHMIRAGLLVPLSGNSAPLGQSLKNAAELALFDIADDRFVLQAYDTRGTPEGAQQAMAQALSQGVHVVLGPVFAASVSATAPLAREGGVVMLSFSSDQSAASEGAYVSGFLLREQARRLVDHAMEHGARRFAALAPDTTFARLMVDAYRTAVQRAGGEITAVEFYPASIDTQTLATQVQRLANYDSRRTALERQRSALSALGDAASQEALQRLETSETFGALPFDVLLLPEDGTRLREVASLLAYYAVDPSQARLLGPMFWNNPELLREPSLVGAWFPAPNPETHGSFVQRYRDTFGSTPPSVAALSYDLTALVAILARQRGLSGLTNEALTDPSGFAGVNGLFRFLLDGTSEWGFAVMEVVPGGATLVGAPPTSFAPLPGLISSPGF